MDIDKISKHFKIGRRLEPEEALEVIMGDIEKPKTKQQILDEKFAEITTVYNLEDKFAGDVDLYNSARSLFDAYISSSTVQTAIDEGDITQLFHTPQLTIDEYKITHDAEVDKPIIEYIKDYINVDKLRV